jgi:Protein of unknown function (DUF3631)
LTAPSLFRFVDHVKPTLFMDNADKLFARKPDFVDVVSVGWTRGTMVPRQDHGVTKWFDPFCAKVVAGVNPQMPKESWSRAVAVRLWPKLPHEKPEFFRHVDDEDFITLRRKLARWTIDNAATLATARPAMPAGFDNRVAMNCMLMFAIADLAGGDWPKQARAAFVKLMRQRREPSAGKRLLAAFRDFFVQHGPDLASAEVQQWLTADKDSEWANFEGKGPISQWGISDLLDPYDIHPGYIHPGGKTARGYRIEQFETAFKHFLPELPPINRATVRKPRGKRR